MLLGLRVSCSSVSPIFWASHDITKTRPQSKVVSWEKGNSIQPLAICNDTSKVPPFRKSNRHRQIMAFPNCHCSSGGLILALRPLAQQKLAVSGDLKMHGTTTLQYKLDDDRAKTDGKTMVPLIQAPLAMAWEIPWVERWAI